MRSQQLSFRVHESIVFAGLHEMRLRNSMSGYGDRSVKPDGETVNTTKGTIYKDYHLVTWMDQTKHAV